MEIYTIQTFIFKRRNSIKEILNYVKKTLPVFMMGPILSNISEDLLNFKVNAIYLLRSQKHVLTPPPKKKLIFDKIRFIIETSNIFFIYLKIFFIKFFVILKCLRFAFVLLHHITQTHTHT